MEYSEINPNGPLLTLKLQCSDEASFSTEVQEAFMEMEGFDVETLTSSEAELFTEVLDRLYALTLPPDICDGDNEFSYEYPFPDAFLDNYTSLDYTALCEKARVAGYKITLSQ
jgi:hypothetical protein